MKKIEKERIVDFLKSWGSNEGEWTELVVLIAEAEGFEDIDLELFDGQIKYSYRLNEVGRKIADDWAAEWDCVPWKTTDDFWDEDRESVENAITEIIG